MYSIRVNNSYDSISIVFFDIIYFSKLHLYIQSSLNICEELKIEWFSIVTLQDNNPERRLLPASVLSISASKNIFCVAYSTPWNDSTSFILTAAKKLLDMITDLNDSISFILQQLKKLIDLITDLNDNISLILQQLKNCLTWLQI